MHYYEGIYASQMTIALINKNLESHIVVNAEGSEKQSIQQVEIPFTSTESSDQSG